MATKPRVTLLDLRPHHCGFSFGHPGKPDFGFCGEPKVNGWAFCEKHARRCYRLDEDKDDEEAIK